MLYVSLTEVNGMITEPLIGDLKSGDKIVVQLPNSTTSYQTFTLTSDPIKVNNKYFQIGGVISTPGPGPQGWVLPIGPLLSVYFIIRGPQGLTGATGPQGLTGATGPTGPAGPAGTLYVTNYS